MGKLRTKMAQDLKLRGLSDKTQDTYLRCATLYTKHYMRPPERMGKQQVRDYLGRPATFVSGVKRCDSVGSLWNETGRTPTPITWWARA